MSKINSLPLHVERNVTKVIDQDLRVTKHHGREWIDLNRAESEILHFCRENNISNPKEVFELSNRWPHATIMNSLHVLKKNGLIKHIERKGNCKDV